MGDGVVASGAVTVLGERKLREGTVRLVTGTLQDMTGAHVYELARLRVEVFIVEQDALYQEFDGIDRECAHILALSGADVIGCVRLVPVGTSYPSAVSFGRLVAAPRFRNCGLGVVLVTEAIGILSDWPGGDLITISAQTYLTGFYGQFGFAESGEHYIEDTRPHVVMHRAAVVSMESRANGAG